MRILNTITYTVTTERGAEECKAYLDRPYKLTHRGAYRILRKTFKEDGGNPNRITVCYVQSSIYA